VFALLLATTSACKHDNASAPPPTTASPSPSDVTAVTPLDVRAAMPIAPSAPTVAPIDAGSAPDAASDAAVFRDVASGLGSLALGDQIGSNFGYSGLGLRGTGRSSGDVGEGTIGLGNIGTMGRSGGGSGVGYGMGIGRFGGRAARIPRVRALPSRVTGTLSAEVVRRVTLRHINEVRFCYEQALAQNPSLQGRVEIQYVIGPPGTIVTSTLTHTDVTVPTVPACIVNATRRWMFPQPEGGGVVSVMAVFVLEPGE
jgi:hypothetical protein